MIRGLRCFEHLLGQLLCLSDLECLCMLSCTFYVPLAWIVPERLFDNQLETLCTYVHPQELISPFSAVTC